MSTADLDGPTVWELPLWIIGAKCDRCGATDKVRQRARSYEEAAKPFREKGWYTDTGTGYALCPACNLGQTT